MNTPTTKEKPSAWVTLKTWTGWLLWCILCCAATLLLAKSSWSHEMSASRLTLVMRDTHHLTLTYRLEYADYVEALHQALAPQRATAEFVLMLAAMPAPEFQKEQARAHAKFSQGTQLNLQNGQALTLTNWQWPSAARAQSLLQQRAMQAVVGRSDHDHEAANDAGLDSATFEIRAEATSARRIDAVNARVPDEFGNVLVVSYQPKQVWLRRGSAATAIKF